MKEYKVAIIGLGYVGLPLAHAFATKYPVIGIDIDPTRIQQLQQGFDRTGELSSEMLKEAVASGLRFSTDIQSAKECNVYIITVPTPIDDTNQPDLNPLISASKSVGTVLKKGDIVIYESTVYPGVTEEVCASSLETASGLKYNKDFFLGYSPERINPGDRQHTITTIKKLTSGSTPQIAQEVDRLYASIIQAGTYLCPSIKVAEAAKVIENTQRDVNIALINELAMIFHTMGIDTHEVLQAASTKWNFLPFTPGLVGGHCIGVDPYYLTYKAQELGYKPNLILGARHINNSMSKYIADRTIKAMVSQDKKIKDSHVLILGLTFKENCPDTRNSKVFDIIKELQEFGCKVDVHDPWAHPDDLSEHKTFRFIEDIKACTHYYDAVIVAVGHHQFRSLSQKELETLCQDPPIIIDVKGIVPHPTWRL